MSAKVCRSSPPFLSPLLALHALQTPAVVRADTSLASAAAAFKYRDRSASTGAPRPQWLLLVCSPLFYDQSTNGNR